MDNSHRTTIPCTEIPASRAAPRNPQSEIRNPQWIAGSGLLCTAIFALVAPLVLAGCAAVPAPAVHLDTAGVKPEVNYDDLAAVLDKATDEKGQLNFDELKKSAPRLETQLKRLAVAGPMATPSLFSTPADRLAYWYNARTAWAIRLAFDANCPWNSLDPAWLEERAFPLDGRTMTLDAIDAVLLREHDWREAAAAPCVRLHRPKLPRKPFAPQSVQADAPGRLNEFLADRDRFIIDVDRQTIFFPPMIWAVRSRLIGQYECVFCTQKATLNTALVPNVTGMAAFRLQNAIGYAEACDSRDGPLACQKH
jgi:hypothetical protein